jgi:hypothetical protein
MAFLLAQTGPINLSSTALSVIDDAMIDFGKYNLAPIPVFGLT